MYQLYCGEKKLFMRGDKLEHLMREAGFVDLKARIVKIEIGEWDKGVSSCSRADNSDARWHKVARVARDVWGEGLVAYAETMRNFYASESEHEDFVRRVRQDMLNLDYHMAVSMYFHIRAMRG